jgi:serine/threonine protein kinase
MAKKAGLPVELSGERANKLWGGILFFLREKLLQPGTVIRKSVEPVAVRHGFIPRHDPWESRAEALRPWFPGLSDPAKDVVLREVVKSLMDQGDYVKKIVRSTLTLHHLQFAQGSFWETTIRSSEFRTVFHSYVRDKKLGQGGNGTVWKMRRDDDFVCAMKLLSVVNSQTTRRDRFLNELWFCALTDHPDIVKVLDWGLSMTGGEAFYVMPLYDGSLRDLMDTGIEPDKVPALFLTALDGIEAAHNAKIWHRDLKPENLLHKDSKRLIIGDFGIAHFTDATKRANVNTRTGAWVANRNYAAPEQRRKNARVDQRADIYALGLILNEMFTGEMALTPDHKMIGSVAPNYAALDGVVQEMLSVSPPSRPSIDKIRAALKAVMHHSVRPIKADPRPRSASSSARRQNSRSSKSKSNRRKMNSLR